MKRLSIAIAGNPNSGKTSIFNALTGMRQHVGNYPGVTVEKKEGLFTHKGFEVNVVDLPGTYSLACRSLEEKIARSFLIHDHPDIIVDVLDASNLERNLYLATQLMELDIPLILVLNMSDRAKAMGQVLDLKYFAELTNTLIVETVGNKKIGIGDLKEAIVRMSQKNLLPHKVDFGPEINPLIGDICAQIREKKNAQLAPYSARWLSIKLLEDDAEIREKLAGQEGFNKIVDHADTLGEKLAKHVGDDVCTVLIEKRYGYISGLYREIATSSPDERRQLSEHIDSILIHRILGIPIFLGLMYFIFYLTFTLGEIPMDWIESFFSRLGGTISDAWPAGTYTELKSLVVDGIIGGVGGVLVFLPNILLLFLAIAILEDSGYLSRAAFIIDRLMHKIGLHGKSFIPMMIGFGCTVPGIMATRTIEDKKDRLTTMMILPLMSCGARLPIYALIIPAFFTPFWRAKVLWLVYVIGIVLAIFLAKIMKKTIFKGTSSPFVMELPPYRLPTIRGLLTHMWERSFMYLKKAGTVILAISIIMWFLVSHPKKDNFDIDKLIASGQTFTEQQVEGMKKSESLRYSIAGRIGGGLEKVLKPLGFDWKISTALIGAFAAKEVFVAQMGIIYALDDANEKSTTLREKLSKHYGALTGFCIMLFCLIATPCMATIAVTRRESGSWKWATLQFVGLTCLAYIITLFVYQAGSLIL
jgi:ferrous iron transport protein B